VRPGRSLVLWPLQVPTYFNAGHHLALYQVAGHLRRSEPEREVDVLDGAVEQLTWKDLVVRLVRNDYEFVAIQCDLEGLEGTERTIACIREIRPQARIVSFGRTAGMVPHVLRGFDFDAIVESGDFETGVAAAQQAFREDAPTAPGVALRDGAGVWRAPLIPGRRLNAVDWYLPLPDEIPHARYESLYSDDTRRFSGLPRQRELVVPVARGCPVGCDYCEVPVVFGRRETRIDVSRVLGYAEACFRQATFDYISFYAPTFTLDRRWVMELCVRIGKRLGRVRWKCCTTLSHLDEQLVLEMGRAGCVRISVGLETLEEPGLRALPSAKERGAQRLADVVRWCTEAGIELNCFVIIGLPQTTASGTEATIRAVHDLGARTRPALYTDWRELTPGLPEYALVRVNRQVFSPWRRVGPDERAHYYRLLVGIDDV
jgi:anaerobic magnesium-protoporphyrin IX monomethyl ester cyclase